jgi:hypothetical protein
MVLQELNKQKLIMAWQSVPAALPIVGDIVPYR